MDVVTISRSGIPWVWPSEHRIPVKSFRVVAVGGSSSPSSAKQLTLFVIAWLSGSDQNKLLNSPCRGLSTVILFQIYWIVLLARVKWWGCQCSWTLSFLSTPNNQTSSSGFLAFLNVEEQDVLFLFSFCNFVKLNIYLGHACNWHCRLPRSE